MEVFNTYRDFKVWRQGLSQEHLSQGVGFVPTMGALHAGHGSLLKKSVNENSITVLSIYVNPTQFNNVEDLKKYPITLTEDLELAKNLDVDAVFVPTYEEIYPDNYKFKVIENDFSLSLCGANRPGHFNGVLTVVMKLLNIVQPQRAYFGEKDFQQLTLIKKMVQAFFMPIEIVACPTMREKNGLAMSSRNKRLSEVDKEKAAIIYKAISSNKPIAQIRKCIEDEGFPVEYLVDFAGRRYIAADVHGVRLIDNVSIKEN